MTIKRKEKRVKDIEKTNPTHSSAGKTLVGTVDARNEAFAFFIPDDKSIQDIFIHKKNFGGAVHSDRVAVRVGVFRGRKEAVVEKVIERGIKKIIGLADFAGKFLHIIPFSRNFTNNVFIKDSAGIKDGDIVECSIEKYPEGKNGAAGKIIRRVCHMSDKDADNKVVLYKYDLRREFPANVVDETAVMGEGNLLSKNSVVPKDFRKLFTVTIDGETARDFDDAISVEESGDGFILYVHIADVSRFVSRDTPTDEEAKTRGTSVYFPQFAIPMLPEIISNDKCSLLPNEDRYTVTAKIYFNKTGEPVSKEFSRSVINSNFRLTYSQVNRILLGGEECHDNDLYTFLKLSEKLAGVMAARRLESGYLDFDSPEASFIFDEQGSVADVISSERGFSERMIEIFMVAANEAAASFLSENKVDAVYRIHGEPDAKKIGTWVEAAKMFGLPVPPLEYPITNEQVAAFAAAASQSKYKDILSSMLIRCMMRAEYSVNNSGHFGLNSRAYTHFTSPIRRYPDLLVHRAILDKIGQGQQHETLQELEELAPKLSKLERSAEDAEHEITLFKKIEYMQSNPGEVYQAYINRVNPSGIFIYVEKLMMTGFIDFATVNFDTFYTDEFSATGKGTGEQFRVGDKIDVKLYSTNIFLLQSDFELIHEKKKKGKK